MFNWTLKNLDTGVVFVLEHDPRGWDSLSITHNRSEEYEGFFSDFSVEVAFGCNGSGKEFVDAAYDLKGSEANMSLTVDYECSPIQQQTIFKGRLNFASYKQEYKDKKLYTVIDIENYGITQQIKNRAETDVDLLSSESIGGTTLTPYTYAPYDLNLHSKVINLLTSWSIEAPITSNSEDYLGGASEIITGTTRQFFHTQAIPLRVQDLEESRDDIDYWIFTNAGLSGSGITEIHDAGLATPIITPATYNWSLNTSGIFNWVAYSGVGVSGTLTITLVLRKDDDLNGVASFASYTIYSSAFALGSITQDFDITDSGTISVVSTDKIWAYWVVIFTATVGTGADFFSCNIQTDTFDFSIDSDTTVPATTCKAVAIHEAWSRISEGITDQTLAFKSEFFGRTNSQGIAYGANGYGSFTVITDGLRIRNFTQSNNPILQDGETKKGIITNLKDIFNSCNAIWGVGLGIETIGGVQVVRVEEKDYFYQDVEIIKLSNIPKIQMQFFEDIAFQEVEIGYKKWKPELKGGLDEPNTIAKWVFIKIKNIKNKLQRVSDYVAGMYAIETTRRQNVAFKLTEDTRFDDEIFIIAVQRDTAHLDICEKDENFTSVTNLLSPSTAYNLRFNLFSNFDRVMNQFTTGLTKDMPQPINYNYLEGNGGMTFQINEGHAGDLNNNVVANVQDTQYAGNGGLHRRAEPILLPEQYTFSFPLTFQQYLTITSNPYGFISFSEGSTNYKKGYLKTLTYSLKSKIADFTLIRKFE